MHVFAIVAFPATSPRIKHACHLPGFPRCFFFSAYCTSVFFDFGTSSLCQGEPHRASLSFSQSDFVFCFVVVSSFGIFVLFCCVCVSFSSLVNMGPWKFCRGVLMNCLSRTTNQCDSTVVPTRFDPIEALPPNTSDTIKEKPASCRTLQGPAPILIQGYPTHFPEILLLLLQLWLLFLSSLLLWF